MAENEPLTKEELIAKINTRADILQEEIRRERFVYVERLEVLYEALGALKWKRDNISPYTYILLERIKADIQKEREYEVSFNTVISEALECLQWHRKTRHVRKTYS